MSNKSCFFPFHQTTHCVQLPLVVETGNAPHLETV